MKTFVVRYGVIAGLVLAVLITLGHFIMQDATIHLQYGMLVGYASMLVSFTFIYVGIKKYRDSLGERELRFGKAFLVGLLIMAIACLFYTLAWTIYVFAYDPQWVDRFINQSVESILKSTEMSPAQKADQIVEMRGWQPMMANPLSFALIGFTEPFPPGILVSLVSALILKKKKGELSQ